MIYLWVMLQDFHTFLFYFLSVNLCIGFSVATSTIFKYLSSDVQLFLAVIADVKYKLCLMWT